MKTRIVQIGNSYFLRIPMPLLKQMELCGQVKINAEGASLVVRRVRRRRAGWAAAFEILAEQAKDELWDLPPATSRWDEEEWEW